MKKTRILTIITIISVAFILSCVPAMAAGLRYTKTLIYFYVNALDEVTVTLVGQASGNITSAAGNQTINMNFTCNSPTCNWVNVSVSGGGTQDASSPGIKIVNTGSAPAQINISSNITLPGSGDASCLGFRYSNATITYPPTLNVPNITASNTTLVDSTSFTNSKELDVWLFGNFSGCNAQTVLSEFYVFAYFTS
jgi:hypothetical protein